MNNIGFYIFAIIAIIVGVLIIKHVVTCLVRSIVIVVLLIILGLGWYFFVGQYDPEIHDAFMNAFEKYNN